MGEAIDSKLRRAYHFVVFNNLEEIQMGVYCSAYGDPTITTYVSDLTASQLRHFKKVCGPFKEEGSAPYITLRSKVNDINIELNGAFQCEVNTPAKKVPVSVQLTPEDLEEKMELLKKLREEIASGTVTEMQHVPASYTCLPAKPKDDPEPDFDAEKDDDIS